MLRRNYNRTETSGSTTMVGPADKNLTIIVIFLVVIGLMAIFSAGAPKCTAAGTNPAGFAVKQFLAILVGCVGLAFFKNYDYKQLSKYAVPWAFFVIVMLVMVKLFGITVYGAKRWISLGFFQLQPSEFAKPAVILLLANAFCNDTKLFVSEKIMNYFLPIMIMMLLVLMQPNLSMVLLFAIISVVIYLTAGGSFKLFAAMFVMGVGALSLVIKPYQLSRIRIWLDPETDPLGAGYNIIQSLMAFAVGGLVGEGFGNSKQKLAWLPEGHTDFIFAVIAEEMGFIGCAFLVCLFVVFVLKGLSIASRCTNIFGKLVATGITLSIGVQAFINMAVSSSLIPATGVTMPFISYGGSSIIVSLSMIGILLNISRKRIKKISIYE